MMPVPVSKQQKTKKRKKLRHNEYYSLQEVFDKLYAQSQKGKVFNDLMKIIVSEENIRLAYRNIKKNTGSKTCGVDNITIKDIENLSEQDFIEIVRKKMSWYKPKAVRRVEIPKPNGKTRPLGIPTIWDRIVQQCILQVLEPICEAKFYRYSHGFRPNRSAEHAIADCHRMIQNQNLHFVVDIDIEGFFDNVNHAKLIKQMWTLGIRDKKLLCIIKEMLKSKIVLENKSEIVPEKGTPQGGILSPLLSNIVLNELDWWIASGWENHPTRYPFKTIRKDGKGCDKSSIYRALRKSKLKEMYIVRYADDFKIFCKKRSDADKIFVAIQQWLEIRLKLKVSKEKSKVVNLRKSYSEFLGIKIKAVKRRNSYVVRSHMNDKAISKISENLKKQIKGIASPKNLSGERQALARYNLMVIGVHNYYKIATCISSDMAKIAQSVKITARNRLGNRLKKNGDLREYTYINKRYGKSKQIRFVGDFPFCPIGYAQHIPPKNLKNGINNYTSEGRKEIHKNLKIDMSILSHLMRNTRSYDSIELADNKVSLYAAQKGRCAVTGKPLTLDDMHCHHKLPIKLGGDSTYQNLVLLHKNVHILIHSEKISTIQKYLELVNPNERQLFQINKFRQTAHKKQINI